MSATRASWVNVVNETLVNTAVPTLVTQGFAVPRRYESAPSLMAIRHFAVGAITADIEIYGYVNSVLDELGAAHVGAQSLGNGTGWRLLDTYRLVAAGEGGEIERYDYLSAFSRVYARVNNIAGVNAWVSVDFGAVEEV